MKLQDLRSSKKARLWIIGILILLGVGALFLVKTTWAKIAIGVMIAILLGAFGMEAANNDYDVQKLIETKSFSGSKIERDTEGNLTNVDSFCNASEADYNCKDFRTQGEAMTVYNRCKTLGKNMDVYRLDGDKDGMVCESLPSGNK